ncbi:g3776 [Coccomyxa elongata]
MNIGLTHATSIGEAVVHALIRRGARVLIIDVNDDDGEALAILHGPKAMYMHCEVTDENGLEQAIQAAMEEFDLPLHAYINCDAIIGALGQIDEMQADSFAATLDLNVKGTFLGIKHAARVMKRDAVIDGAIVTLSSTAAVRSGIAPVAFTASQHAVIGLTQQAAAELAPAGIRVNCVSPTVLDTPMWCKYLKGDISVSLADDLRSKQAKHQPTQKRVY